MKRLAVRWASCVLVLACAGPVSFPTQVETPGDVAKLATYSIDPNPRDTSSAPNYTPEMGEKIRQAIDAALRKKGYAPAGYARVDFEVAFVVSGHSSIRIVNAGDPDADYYVEREYAEGTLVIIAHDGQGTTLWRGSVETELATSGALIPPNLERVATRAAGHLMSRFPERVPDAG